MSAPAFDPTLPPEATAVECPLCDYDLRGLIEPRCPECGYTFDWLELTDPGRRRHPYLFEHHPERNVWSFARTILGHLRPRKFWGGLLPSQPSDPLRLVIYALLITLSVFPPIFLQALVAAEMQRTITARRAATGWMVPPSGTLSVPWTSAFGEPFTRAMVRGAVRLHALVLLWPILTLATLMIFVVSMRRARVRRVHFVRCVVYAADVILWINFALALALTFALGSYLLFGGTVRYNWDEVWLGGVLLALAVFPYRLCVAFKKYLRFDHPISTILATQSIVALSMILIVLNFG